MYHNFADCLEIFLQRYVDLFQNSNKVEEVDVKYSRVETYQGRTGNLQEAKPVGEESGVGVGNGVGVLKSRGHEK